MENVIFKNVQERLNKGQNPKVLFDNVDDFHEGFACVKLYGKHNFIDMNGKLLSNQWFDDCFRFFDGFAWVKLNGEYNFIDKNGDYLSPNQWFNGCSGFYEGFAHVELNGKDIFIDKDGKHYDENKKPLNKNIVMENVTFENVQELLNEGKKPEEVFDYVGNFKESFAWVYLNGKCNFIDKNCKILSPNQWFDSCRDFYEGFAIVRINGERNFIDSKGNLYDENKNPININNEKPNTNNHKDTLIINLYGGPGTGKSTGAAYIFSRLKLAGIDAEYVSEFAKDKVWENNCSVFDCQFYITGKQAFRIKRCFGKVDVIITDSPIRLGEYYAEQCGSPKLSDACREEADRYNNNSIDIFLERKKEYNPNGRNQTEEEAKKIDEEIIKLLVKDKIKFFRFNATEEGYNDIINFVLKEINIKKRLVSIPPRI